MNAPEIIDRINLLDWSEAARQGPNAAGGKGTHLGRLARYDLPVADGCVIPVEGCRALLGGATHRAALQACALQEPEHSAALERLRQRIREQAIPPALNQALNDLLESKGWHDVALAIRSSAPSEDSAQASFAGIHHSVLNVIGHAAMADAIRVVCASLWTPQAVAYRARIGMPHAAAAMAVVLMPMIPAVASGVVFTRDPQSGREDRMVISGVRGLGEALVSGLVAGEDIVLGCDLAGSGNQWQVVGRRAANATLALEPDPAGSIRRRPLTLEEQSTPVLDDEQAAVLGALAAEAANALDFSAPWYDIEWVWDGSRFHLVQARPITVRPWHTYPELQGQAPIWTNGNTREVAPHVFTASEMQPLLCSVNMLIEMPRRLIGLPVLAGAQRAALFHGRAYLNASLIQWEVYDGFGVAPKATNQALGGHQPEIAVPPLTLRQKMVHAVRKLRALAKSPAMRRQGLADSRRIFTELREWRRSDLGALGDASLISCYIDLSTRQYARHPGLCLMQSFSGALMELLGRMDKKFPGESNALVAALMAGGEPSITAQQGYDLMHLAGLAREEAQVRTWLQAGHEGDWQSLPAGSEFRAAFADFLEKYGHRGVYESYLWTPRWREAPAFVLASIAGLLDADAQHMCERQQQSVESAWVRVATRASWAERHVFRLLLTMAKRECNQRELARSTFTAIGESSRLTLLEIGRRLVARGLLDECQEVFHLTAVEHRAALRGELKRDAVQARIADRVKMARQWDADPAAEVIIEGGDGIRAESAPVVPLVNGDNMWRGVAVGSGYIQGKVRIVRHPNEQSRLQRGEILLAPSTDPSWLPLFLKAGGLILETGGYLSHGAIVAREFGIPAVVNLPGIMAQLQDGEMVAIDSRQGIVVRFDIGSKTQSG